MKNIKRFVFFLILSLFSVVSFAQQDTEFWFAAPYINCEHGNIYPYRLVVFAFDRAATVTISMPANPDFEPIIETVAANSYANIVLAQDKSDGDVTITTPFNEITQRGLLITSTSKIECYYQIDGDNSEAFTLKGQNALGTDFLVAGQKSYDNGFSGDWEGARSSAHIVATEDNTLVRIVPTCAILEMEGVDTIAVVLQKGETYAVAAADNIASSNLIGSRIFSSAPIAVTMNDDSVTPNGENADDIGEQLLSTDFAGMNFVVVAEGDEYELCTVFALEDNTQITTSDGAVYNIDENEFQVISLADVYAMSIHTNRPVMLFQVVAVDGGGELGGTIVPHVECTGSMIAGYMPFSMNYNIHLNLITRKNNIFNFTINGESVASSLFSAVDSSGEYYYARIEKPATDNPYVVKCSSGIFQMGVSEGGSDGSNTYGFFSDYEQHIPVIVEVNSNIIDSIYYVNASDNLYLSAYPSVGFKVQDVIWTLPDGTIKHGNQIDLGLVTPNLIGEYHVSAMTEQCGEIYRSFKIRYKQAIPVVTSDVLCEGDMYTWEGHYMADGVTPLIFSESGTYRDTLVDSRGNDSVCVLELEVVPVPVLKVRPDTTIHLGDKVLLWATGADYIQWSPNIYLTQNDEMQYVATPQTTIQYTATGYNIPAEGNNVVYNGDFELGNIGFETDFNYFTPYTYPGGYGDYTITDDVMGYWYGHVESVKAYGGSGNMMILDGMTTPHAVVWRQEIAVTPNTMYAFSAQVMSALDSHMEGQYALLQFAVNDQQVGPIFHSPNRLYEWEKFYSLWYSGEATTAVLTIYNQNDNPYGNDFALDEIRFEELHMECPATEIVTISIAGEVHMDTTVCADDVPFDWNGISITSSGIYQAIIPSSSGSIDSIINLDVMVLPEVPLTELYDTICFGGQYEWYDSTYVNSTIDTVVLADMNGCDSALVLHLVVLPEVSLTEVVDTICYGGQYEWHDSIYIESTTDTIVLADMNGCDSVLVLHLVVLPEVPVTEKYDTICYAEVWYGVAWTESGDYTITLQDIHGCDSVVLWHLTVLPEVPVIQDTVSICYGESFEWNDMTYAESGDYTIIMSNVDGCDSVVTLHLEVLPTTYDITDTIIVMGETCIWNGVEYSESVVQVDTLVNMYGCDSIVIFDLKVVENKVIVHDLEVMDMCADDGVLELMVSWDGYIDSVGLCFERDSLGAIMTGLYDTIVSMPADGYVSIPYSTSTSVRAGVYSIRVQGYFHQKLMFEEMATFSVLYPSSIMEKRWDDVICILTSGYNGGYDFTAFQWYKDGSPLAGETGYYLNQMLEQGAEYSALLTEVNGTQLMTCPLVIGGARLNVSVEPTLVAKQQPVRCQVSMMAKVWVYDVMGKVLVCNTLQQGETYIQMPQRSGIYLLKVVLQTGEEKNFRVLVL